METGSATTIAQAVRDVERALDRAALAPVMSASDSDLLAALAATPVLRNKLDALCGRVTRAAEQSRAVNRDDSRTASIWLGKQSSVPPQQVRADVRRAKWLEGFAEFTAAHEAGLLGTEHVRVLRRADRPEFRLALIRDQHIFVQLAEHGDFAGFENAVQHWINCADPDGQIPAEQERNNHFSAARRSDGSVSIKGELDPLLGTEFTNALDAEFDKIMATYADAPHADRPTRPAMRAQALAKLVAKGALRQDGTLPAPLINIVMSEQVAEALVEGLVPHIDPEDVDGRCEFLDGTPLHPAFAAKLMPRAIFRRIVFDADSRPIDVSVNARLFPRWMKDVALVQTRGKCAEPGCDTPTRWLHADHIQPHSRGGPTALDKRPATLRPRKPSQTRQTPATQIRPSRKSDQTKIRSTARSIRGVEHIRVAGI